MLQTCCALDEGNGAAVLHIHIITQWHIKSYFLIPSFGRRLNLYSWALSTYKTRQTHKMWAVVLYVWDNYDVHKSKRKKLVRREWIRIEYMRHNGINFKLDAVPLCVGVLNKPIKCVDTWKSIQLCSEERN
jgi:hypothetical protein